VHPPATSSAPPPSVANLARALAALARGLPNPADESTDYFRQFVAPLAAATALDASAFKSALGIAGRYRVDLSPADSFFSGASDPQNWGEYATGFRQLEQAMHATLTDVSTAFARATNVVRVRMWLFGRTGDGWLVGLHSIVTET
jgi:hypothetical protein